MKTELLRHIEILKTVSEIKESIEELKPGCWVTHERVNNWEPDILRLKKDNYTNWYITEAKIIWQVEERHLRMFINYHHELMCIWNNWDVIIDEEWKWMLDNTKPYMEQSEEFFKKLNDWLIKEFNINL